MGRDKSCESMFARGLSVNQKCSNYTLTNLLLGLCRSMWVINLLVNFPCPHPGAPACPSTPEVLQARECAPTLFPSVIVTFWLTIGSIKELGGVSMQVHGHEFKIHNTFSLRDSTRHKDLTINLKVSTSKVATFKWID